MICKYIKQAYLGCATRTTKCWWPQSYKTNYQKEQVDFFMWSRHKYHVGSVGKTIFQILTSFDNVEKSNNKGEENIKNLDIKRFMNNKFASLQHGKEEWKYWNFFIPPSISIASKCCSMGIVQFEKHSRCVKPLFETCKIWGWWTHDNPMGKAHTYANQATT